MQREVIVMGLVVLCLSGLVAPKRKERFTVFVVHTELTF